MKVFVILFKDGDVYGCSKSMNSDEAEATYKGALSLGYEVIKICINDMFESSNILNEYLRDIPI